VRDCVIIADLAKRTVMIAGVGGSGGGGGG
jgi:hypothetical protein